MDAEKYNRTLAMVCPTCGCTEFKYEQGVDETIEIVRCARCEREMTKDELLRENSENISAHVEEIKQEALNDVTKELKQILKDAFKGSDFIKVK